jgi:hypothetical protein
MLSGFLNVRSAAAKQSVITAINLLGLLLLTSTGIYLFIYLFVIFIVLSSEAYCINTSLQF